jgi:nucleoside-diphosphate-sugar epimerase
VPRALITGATGQVGSYIVERAREAGWPIRALTRKTDSARWLGDDVELVAGDVLDAASFVAAARGCDVVFHAAAAITATGGWDEYRALNLDGTANAIAAARSSGARLLHVSSVAVYGPGMRYQSGRLTDEAAAFETLPDALYYARSKRDSEQMVLDAHAAGSIWATAIRPDVIYGRRDRQFVPRIARLLRFGFAPLVGGGESTLPIVHARNVAEGAWLAANTDAAGGQAYNVKEFFMLAGEGLGTRVRGIVIPMPVARVMLQIAAQIIGLVRGRGLRAMSGGTLSFLTRDNPFTSERAKRELGWKPVIDPSEGIPDAFRWWKMQRMQKGRDHSRPSR